MRDFKYRLDGVKAEYYKTENSIIISQDIKHYKQFAVISKEDIEGIKKDNNYYEVIIRKDGYCYKMYYDIDLYIDKDKIDEYNIKIDDFIDKVSQLYKGIDEDYKKEDVITIDASREGTDGKYKLSKHIIIPIYVNTPDKLYTIFTFIQKKIQNKIDEKIYEAIDKGVYVKNDNMTQQLRLLGQSKIGKPESILKCENPDIKLKDTLITQFDTDGKKLIDTTEMEKLLKRMNEKEGRGFITKTNIRQKLEEGEDAIGKDRHKNGYDYKDMLLLDITPPKFAEYISNTDVITFYKERGFSSKTDCEFYLSVIQNTPNNKLAFGLWWIIGTIVKKYKVDYKVFESFTLKAYTSDLNKVAEECKKKWDKMKEPKYGLLHLINIARAYNKEIYLKKAFAKRFINQYYYDKDEWENIKMGADETMDINKYYKDGKIGLVTDENVGGGKTNSVIRFTKEHIHEDYFTIIFSNRIYFATEISSRFETELGKDKVLNYDEHRKEDDFDLTDKKVLIISFESLIRRQELIDKRISKKTKLICVYDEFETLHRNINAGEILKRPYQTISYLTKLWNKSVFNIVIDAYMTKSTYEYVNKQNELSGKTGSMIYIDTDNRNKYPKTFNIRGIAKTADEKDEMMLAYTAEMGQVLNESEENRIVIFCEIYTSVQYIVNFLINTIKIPAEQVLVHTGKDKLLMTPAELEEAKSYLQDKEKMKTIRVWIYTSSILNGVSVENVEFKKCYGIITRYSKQELRLVGIYGNDFLNAIARSRLNRIWEVYIELKEAIGFTYQKWRRDLLDRSIDADIKRDITNEINEKNEGHLCYTSGLDTTNYEDDWEGAEEEQRQLQQELDEISKLNNCFINPATYHISSSSGMCGVNKIEIYEKVKRIKDNIEECELVKYMEVSELKIEEYNDRGLLRGDIKANEMLRIVYENNSKMEEFNGIFKIEVVECLAVIKNNIINWKLDVNDNYKSLANENAKRLKEGKEPIKSADKVKCAKNWNDRTIPAIDTIHRIVEKYYGLYDGDKEGLCKMLNAEPTILNYIQVWITIITKTDRYKKYNPYYIKKILYKIFNIKGLDELPNVIYPEKVEEERYYEKSKDVINDFKKSRKLKITPDPTTKTSSVFMKWWNEILKDTGYYYKEKKVRCKIVKYELHRVRWEGVIADCSLTTFEAEQFQLIWKDRKNSFIDDDDDE